MFLKTSHLEMKKKLEKRKTNIFRELFKLIKKNQYRENQKILEYEDTTFRLNLSLNSQINMRHSNCAV